MQGVSNWVIALLVFNALLLIFMGFFGQTFASEEAIQDAKENPLLPNFTIGLVLGFKSMPAWINAILSLQAIIAIYLLLVSITGGS